jgi:hypothetical protein
MAQTTRLTRIRRAIMRIAGRGIARRYGLRRWSLERGARARALVEARRERTDGRGWKEVGSSSMAGGERVELGSGTAVDRDPDPSTL